MVSDWVTILDAHGKPLAGVTVTTDTGEPMGISIPLPALPQLAVPTPPVGRDATIQYGQTLIKRFFGATNLRLTQRASHNHLPRVLTWTDSTGTDYKVTITSQGVSIRRRRVASEG